MRVHLEQVDTFDIDSLRQKVAALSNKDKVRDQNVIEDRSRVYRYGTVSVRWSYLSDKWILQDGVAIEGTYDTAKEAVIRAKEVSGYEDESESPLIHPEPVPMEFDGTVPLDVIQSFQPSMPSAPGPSPGGFGGGGGGGGGSFGGPPMGGGGGLPSIPPTGPESSLPKPDIGGSMAAPDGAAGAMDTGAAPTNPVEA